MVSKLLETFAADHVSKSSLSNRLAANIDIDKEFTF